MHALRGSSSCGPRGLNTPRHTDIVGALANCVRRSVQQLCRWQPCRTLPSACREGRIKHADSRAQYAPRQRLKPPEYPRMQWSGLDPCILNPEESSFYWGGERCNLMSNKLVDDNKWDEAMEVCTAQCEKKADIRTSIMAIMPGAHSCACVRCLLHQREAC